MQEIRSLTRRAYRLIPMQAMVWLKNCLQKMTTNKINTHMGVVQESNNDM